MMLFLLYLVWIALYVMEQYLLFHCGSMSSSSYTNIAIVIYMVYKFYAFWVVMNFYRELKSCGVLNRALRELSDQEVDQFFKGGHNQPGTDKIVTVDITTPDLNFANLPYKPNFEIAADRVQIDEGGVPLGSGTFGTVLKAKLMHLDGQGSDVVAVKTSSNCDEFAFRALLTEIKILSYVGKHENVVNLIGACTANLKQRDFCMVLEFCPFGSVLNYLRANRAIFIDCTDPVKIAEIKSNCSYITTACVGGPSTLDLIKWAMQTADGMQFISSKKIVHSDLAARNVLLTANLDVKIADFGLSRQLYKYTTYVKNGNDPLPWRWMAIECFTDRQFSTPSDVWAFGVTLWEYFTCGGTPFVVEEFSQDFVQRIQAGHLTLLRPSYASTEIYKMMKKCWNFDPKMRPTFEEMKAFFAILVDQSNQK